MFFLVCVVGLSVATPAAAAERSPSEAERQRAVELVQKSRKHYKAGEFSAAAELLQQAYATYPEPVLQFNLAKAFEGMGRFEKAVAAYEIYLATALDVEDRPAIEARVATLKREIEQRAALRRQRDAERQRADKAKGKTRVVVKEVREPASPWPWITTGVGLAAAATGVTLWAVGKNQHDSAQDASAKDAADRVDTAQSLATWGNVLVVSGSVVTAAGLTWVLLSDGGGERQAGITLHPAGAVAWGAF